MIEEERFHPYLRADGKYSLLDAVLNRPAYNCQVYSRDARQTPWWSTNALVAERHATRMNERNPHE